MAKKVAQVPLDAVQEAWINKGMKELKIKKQAEFFRTIISYLMEADITELKTKMEKARITAMLQDAQIRADKALHEREQLEKQLERIGA